MNIYESLLKEVIGSQKVSDINKLTIENQTHIDKACSFEIRKLCNLTSGVVQQGNGSVILKVVMELLPSLSLSKNEKDFLMVIIRKAYTAGIKTAIDSNSGFHSNGFLLELYSYLDNCDYQASPELWCAVHLLNYIIETKLIIKTFCRDDGSTEDIEDPIIQEIKHEIEQDDEFLNRIDALNQEAVEEKTQAFCDALTSDAFTNAINNFCDSVGSESSKHFKDKVKEIVLEVKSGKGE